jgi:hypothetical protein
MFSAPTDQPGSTSDVKIKKTAEQILEEADGPRALERGTAGYTVALSAVEAALSMQSAPIAQLATECVKSVSEGYSVMDHRTQEVFCAECGVSLDDGEEHKPDCLTLRARAFLSDPAFIAAESVQNAVTLVTEHFQREIQRLKDIISGLTGVRTTQAVAGLGIKNPYINHLARYWQLGFDGKEMVKYVGNKPLVVYTEGCDARRVALAAKEYEEASAKIGIGSVAKPEQGEEIEGLQAWAISNMDRVDLEAELLRLRAAAAESASAPVELPQGWEASHLPNDDSLTDEANARTRVAVRRLEPPFCDMRGNRQWSGPTLAAALGMANQALGLPTSPHLCA